MLNSFDLSKENPEKNLIPNDFVVFVLQLDSGLSHD